MALNLLMNCERTAFAIHQKVLIRHLLGVVFCMLAKF